MCVYIDMFRYTTLFARSHRRGLYDLDLGFLVCAAVNCNIALLRRLPTDPEL